MARPSIHDTGPVIGVRVIGSAQVATWCNGVYTGDREIMAHAQECADRGQDYLLGSTWVTCDDSTPLSAAASLMHFAPVRMELLTAPNDVRNALSIWESGLSYAGVPAEEI